MSRPPRSCSAASTCGAPSLLAVQRGRAGSRDARPARIPRTRRVAAADGPRARRARSAASLAAHPASRSSSSAICRRRGRAFTAATSLQVDRRPRLLPLTLDCCAPPCMRGSRCLRLLATFWIARALFARGGIRTFITSRLGVDRARCPGLCADTRRARRSCTASGVRATRAHGRSDPSSIATTSEPGACWRSACASAVYSGDEPRAVDAAAAGAPVWPRWMAGA